MAAVTLNKVKKVYPNGYEAIHGLDLHIEDQEFLVVVGPSGCGKSTALRMIAGLEEISGGELSIGENIVTDEAPKDRDIAMVFQNYALYPHKTVRENIGFALKLAKVPSAERTQRVNEAAQILELTDLLDRKPAQLSGGQRQRVAMGRAIVRRPAAFLMDEPLSNLDAKLRVQMRAEISALQRELGVTTVYVTHDQTEAMTMGDRVAVLKDGHLQQVGTPAELYDNPANVFVAGFIGSPSMNLFEATLEERTLRLGSVALELPQSLFDASPELVERRGQDLIVGIRPEDLEDPRYAPADRYQGKIPAVVSLTELLGSEVIAHLDVEATRVDSGDPDAVETLGASPAVGRFDSRTAVTAGDSLEVAVAIDRFHFFDAKTRNAIAGPR